jgi:putative Holliday junction resolvase
MLNDGTILALDVGSKRIGLALASYAARLSNPYDTVANDDNIWHVLRTICQKEAVKQLVVGLPRGLDSQSTTQTAYTEDFARRLATEVALPLSLVDEAVTSKQAKAELMARGKKFAKSDIDALAAVYILEDYLHEYMKAEHWEQ